MEGDCWIFGYGSLVWKTNFPYEEKEVGYIKGFARRFYHGSTDHRGVPGKELAWGVAYRIHPSKVDEVMAYLDMREQDGYSLQRMQFYPRKSVRTHMTVLVYIAMPSSSSYLGEAPLEQIALQVAQSHGPSGPNHEYVSCLADAMREIAPEAEDKHLYELDALVRVLLNNPTCNRSIADQHNMQTSTDGGDAVCLRTA